MSGRAASVASGVLGCLLGLAGALLLVVAPEGYGLPLAVGLVCWTAFTLWPWLIVPAGLFASMSGAVVAATPLDAGRIMAAVPTVHACVLLGGAVAIATRRLFVGTPGSTTRSPADHQMLLVFAIVGMGAGYGLAAGNGAFDVTRAATQLAVVPVYFFLTRFSLTSQHDLLAAGITFVGATTALVLGGLVFADLNRGFAGELALLAALALAPAVVAASRTSGRRRAALVLSAGLLTTSVVLFGAAWIWLTASVVTGVVLAAASQRIRVQVLTALGTAAVLTLVAAVARPEVSGRVAALPARLEAAWVDIREPAWSVALNVFTHSPLLGEGLGLSTSGGFWVGLLASLGLVGAAVVAWPLLIAIRRGVASWGAVRRDSFAFVFAVLTCGFSVGAAFAAPVDGHVELGLLPALTLLAAGTAAGHASLRRDVGATGGQHAGTDHRARAILTWLAGRAVGRSLQGAHRAD
jgi:hypothetical protein